ncbi:hypothetical protein TNCV_4037841 [Trichonephila clavipes]|nr:hypothetical protein TNCV_4037841 [Trichonephila clavipes]
MSSESTQLASTPKVNYWEERARKKREMLEAVPKQKATQLNNPRDHLQPKLRRRLRPFNLRLRPRQPKPSQGSFLVTHSTTQALSQPSETSFYNELFRSSK